MSEGLPQQLDLIRAARQGAMFNGTMDVHRMLRLRDYLSRDQGKVAVQIELDTDKAGIPFISGHATANLIVQCQRCLGDMPIALETGFRLALITSERGVESLPDDYEPLVVTESPAVLQDIVEDELILAMPIVNQHAPDQCEATSLIDNLHAEREQVQKSEKENPFAVLKKLKTDG